jgi:uncharacterized repeat protein (TIGR03803 family)
VIARDSAGNLYACGGTALYKVTPSGQATTLYTFTGGADGSACIGVALGPAGNLYGVGGPFGEPNGSIFELTAAGQFTILHTFTDGSDGSLPNAGLALDLAGNVYGTANEGGNGAGTVYEITSAGEFIVLHAFTELGRREPVFWPDPNVWGQPVRDGGELRRRRGRVL